MGLVHVLAQCVRESGDMPCGVARENSRRAGGGTHKAMHDTTRPATLPQVVTFDAFGVSGHANHRATFDGVALLARRLRDHRTALRAIENFDPDGADHGAGRAGRRGGHANVPDATARATNGPGDGADAAWQSHCHKVDACYALETVGLARKYIGVFDVIVSCLLQPRYRGRRS